MIQRLFRASLLLLLAATATAQTTLPTPDSVLGFRPGADYKLATYDDAVRYFRALDAASDRMTIVEMGASSEGRTYVMALISSPANLAKLARYREIAQRLAHPAGLSEDEARQLAREGRAFVHIDGGLHATEVAGPNHTLQLAYDLLARADEPDIAAILDQVVLMLWPTINPDGQQMVAEWYRANVGTPYEVAPLPTLYQAYVGHDNNRDGYMLNMIESRVMEHAWRYWEPQIVYVHHQTAPFPTRIWLPPFAEPVAPRVPYLLSREVNMIGMAIAKGLEERGQVGATHMGTGFDAWYPGYIDYKPMLQNVASFWTETALYGYATPRFYTIGDLPAGNRDLRAGSLYSSPWPGGWWRLRDAVEYMETASLSVLDYAARYKESLLLNRYRAGRDQIARYTAQPPYAYVIPQQQRDPMAAVELLRRLAFQGVRVSQLTAPAAVDRVTYPAGTWVIPMDQEFAETARQLFDVQQYPDIRESPDGPLEQPYDAAGWTLPYQMDVRVAPATTPLAPDTRAKMRTLGSDSSSGRPKPAPTSGLAPTDVGAGFSRPETGSDAGAGSSRPEVFTPYQSGTDDAAPFDSVPGLGFEANAVAAAIVPPAATITGTGPALAVDPAQNNAFRAINRAWKAGGAVRRDQGRYLLTGLTAAVQTDLVNTLALGGERGPAGGRELKRPRIGLYRPWIASMDEGWTRWLLESYGFEPVTLRPADFHGPPLADRVDVVILADEARGLLDGHPKGTVPPQYEGGLGADGVRALDAFVRGGGTLVCFNRSSTFAIEQLRLPVRNVVGGLERQEFFTGGSIVQVTTDPSHPVMAGMPERAAVFVDGSPAFQTLDGFAGTVLARYQASGSPLMSGYLVGEKYLQGQAAAVDVALDRGHVVLIGFRPQWRGQPFGTFRVVFNAALYSPGTAR